MRLLIVGSLEGHIATAGQIALAKGAKVSHVDDTPAALEALRGGQGADLIMVDVVLDVAELIEALKAERIAAPVIACGIGNDSRAAVRAIKAGAKEYVPLPPDPELIGAVLAAVAEETTAFLTRDTTMMQVLRMAERVAPSEASVLITGESGTGKEVMARHIHGKSKRAEKPFISVNCAAIPENLLESELFGHEKGAFTGAVARRVGKFEEANGGTLLLDEISEMDPRLQAKLLRAIQEREIDRVGGSKPVKVDIRLLATSNRDMQEAVRSGAFREDLFFRLNVVNVALPPLRARPEDIEVLARHFARKYAKANGVHVPAIADDAMQQLVGHVWPGNVRELENAIHRAILLARDGVIEGESILLQSGPHAGHGALSGSRSGAGRRPSNGATDGTGNGASHGSGGGAGGGVRNAPAEAGYRAYGAVAGERRPTAARASLEEAAFDEAFPEEDAEGDEARVRGLVGRTVADVERDLILNTLEHCLGNRTHAANILGISIRTLRNKLKAYSENGVDVPSPGDAGRVSV